MIRFKPFLAPAAILIATTLVGGLIGSQFADPVLPDDRLPVFDTEGERTDLVDRGALGVDVSDLAREDGRPIPVLEPVLVAFGDETGDFLLDIEMPDSDGSEIPVPAAGLPEEPADAFVIIPEPSEDGPAPEPGDSDVELFALSGWWFIRDGWVDLFPEFYFDPCAGAEPGSPPPPGCPPGAGARVLAFDIPATFAFFSRGHYLGPDESGRRVCAPETPGPIDTQRPMTVFSWTPLADISVRYRPYGTDLAWESFGVTGSPEDHISWWNLQLEDREYDPDWGIVPVCFNFDGDPNIAYELQLDATDVFGRPVTANPGLVTVNDPTLRPPTTAQVLGLSPIATISAYTHAAGMVKYRSGVITDESIPADCSIARDEVPASQLWSTTDRPSPIGLYDPLYNKKVIARVPVPAAGKVLVCAEIFHTDNPLQRLVTDRILITAPTQQRPKLVLQGIRRLGDAVMPAGTQVSASAIGVGEYEPCARGYYVPELPPGPAHRVEETLWECTSAPLPLDSSGAGAVTVTVTRNFSGSPGSVTRREQVSIPLQLNDCRVVSCERPREWYEVPIPSQDGVLCSGEYLVVDCGPLDGIAVVRVEYPVVEGSDERFGTITMLDHIAASVIEGTPRISSPDVAFTQTPFPLYFNGSIRFFTDRPVRAGLTAVEVLGEGCYEGGTVPMTEEFATSFHFEMSGFCAGDVYSFTVDIIDEGGVTHSVEVRLGYSVPFLGRVMDTRVDFLGGSGLPRLGWFYRFNVLLDGQSTTWYWYDFTAGTRTSDQCMGLSGTSATSRGAPREIFLHAPTLSVDVMVHISTTGEDDCSTRSGSGLGEINFHGEFTPEQLFSGEPLVMETGPDAVLGMRLTLTPRGDWRTTG